MNQKKKILIVDDDKMIVWLIEQALKSEEFELYTAYNGADALEKALKIYPDLMILDLNMPVMDGYEVCEQLQQREDMTDVTLLLLSALVHKNGSVETVYRGSLRQHLQAEDLGADAFLSKPLRLKELRARVEAMLLAVPVPVM